MGLGRFLPPFKELDTLNGRGQTGPHLSPQGQAPRFPHDWLKLSGARTWPCYDWMDHSGRMHQELTAKEGHPSWPEAA